MAEVRDIELVLVTGAGASCGLGANGKRIAAMKEWSERLTGALGMDPGSALLVKLSYGIDGMEFERRLGSFIAQATAFRKISAARWSASRWVSWRELTRSAPGFLTTQSSPSLTTCRCSAIATILLLRTSVRMIARGGSSPLGGDLIATGQAKVALSARSMRGTRFQGPHRWSGPRKRLATGTRRRIPGVQVDEKLTARLDDLITKADQVLATHKPNPPNYIGFTTLNSGAFAEWQTQSLSFLINLLGASHVYVESFRERVEHGHRSDVGVGKGILQAVREDLSLGYLAEVRALVAAEVFSDFLEMADHLLDAGYHDPAASLSGAVLENGLRQIAAKHGVTVKARDDLSSLNSKCAAAGVYNRLVQKKAQVWIGVRNHADHGEFSEYQESDVRDMLAGVRDFLGTYV